MCNRNPACPSPTRSAPRGNWDPGKLQGSRVLQGSGQSALCFPRLGKCRGSCSSLKTLFWLGTGGVFSLSSSGMQILSREIRIPGEKASALRLWMSRVWGTHGSCIQAGRDLPRVLEFHLQPGLVCFKPFMPQPKLRVVRSVPDLRHCGKLLLAFKSSSQVVPIPSLHFCLSQSHPSSSSTLPSQTLAKQPLLE